MCVKFHIMSTGKAYSYIYAYSIVVRTAYDAQPIHLDDAVHILFLNSNFHNILLLLVYVHCKIQRALPLCVDCQVLLNFWAGFILEA